MILIEKDGTQKQACERCHRVNVKFSRKGKQQPCDDCRRHLWDAELRYRRNSNRRYGDDFYKITSRRVHRQLLRAARERRRRQG